MKYQLTLTANSAAEFAELMLRLQKALPGLDVQSKGNGQVAPTADTPTHEQAPAPHLEQTPAAPSEPQSTEQPPSETSEPEPPTTPTAASDDDEIEKAHAEAMAILMKAWSVNKDAKTRIRKMLDDRGVESFKDVPKTAGPELLVEAQQLQADLNLQ